MVAAAAVGGDWRASASTPDPGVIDTVAGIGSRGYSGDGGPATDAALNAPRTLAVDPQGTIYVADTDNHVIRAIDLSGTITTIAGSGQPGVFGDGGPATAAAITSPHSVAADGSGNVYIADTRNHRVRRVDAGGIITTVAGTGRAGFSGDGGPAAAAFLNNPKGVAVDGDGRLYIADTGNHRIRRVDHSGVIITVAGNGTAGGAGDGGPATAAQVTNPRAVALDGAGNLAILEGTEGEVGRLRRVDGNGEISHLAGVGGAGFDGDGGPATDALVNNPRDLAADHEGNVYVADSENRRVRKIDTSGTITTIAGAGLSGDDGDGGPAIDAELSVLRGIAVGPLGDVFVADSGNHKIRRVSGVAAPAPGSDPDPDPDPPAGPGSAPDPGEAPPGGYWVLQDDGRVHAFGDAPALDDVGANLSGATAVDLAATPSGGGSWVVTGDGRVVATGDAVHFGDAGALAPGDRVASISATPTGQGYWLFTSQGEALGFGDAHWHGDMAGVALNGPILDSVATPTGGGYWMVASDGGIFTFGDARFHGSMGDRRLNAPVLSLVPTPDGAGYWLVAADGGVFAFNAPFRGSMGGTRLNRPVTGMVAYGDGYLMVAADGGVFTFSDRPFSGSLGDQALAQPVVAVAALDPQ